MHHPAAQHRLRLRRVSRHAYGLIAAAAIALALAAPAAAQPVCGETITQDTTLTADLACGSESAPALRIGASGITLDLGGHTLSISDIAISDQGHDNVTIRNGTILSFQETIRLEGVSGSVIRDIDTNGLILGITLVDSHDNRIVHNTLTSVSLGLRGSDHNVIAHNIVTRYEGSIGLGDSSYNRVVDNVVWSSRDIALGIGAGSHHNVVRRNMLLNDTFAVVRLSGAEDNELTNNTIASHGPSNAPGAEINESSRNLVARNTMFGVTQGFWLRSGADNVFRRNDVAGVPVTPFPPQEFPDGFLVEAAATGTVLQANTVRGFDDDGIDVNAEGTSLRGNAANDNGQFGIEAVPAIIDLGGNTASGNRNPLQCLNVVCS
jgi:hypothetical protein